MDLKLLFETSQASEERLGLVAKRPAPSIKRPSRKRWAIAFAVAAASDAISFWAEIALPLQWALDLATAFLLFLLLGRRWALLPGLIAEAIPGLGVIPVWLLVVLSILLYDDIRGPQKIAS